MEDKLISCVQHIDEDVDMLCDVCKKEIAKLNNIKEKELEETLTDNSVVKIAGCMPEDTVLETTTLEKENAVNLAQKYLPKISSDDVLCAYDISMISKDSEYEPEEYNQVVKVNISNMDLEIKDTVVLLHIIDEDNYEIIPLSSINENGIEFNARRFSTYILINLESNEITTGAVTSSDITLIWDAKDGVRYEVSYTNENGTLTLLEYDATSPYVHLELEKNQSYEYVVIGYDEDSSETVSIGSVVGNTLYDDIYDIISKDTVKPAIDEESITITPSTGNVDPSSEIVIDFNFIDENYDSLNGSLLHPNEIEVLIDGLDATSAIKDLTKESITNGERFTLSIKNIWGNGELSIKIPAGAIKDLALNSNDEYIISTGLNVIRSRVQPVTSFSASNGDGANSITIKFEDTANTEAVTYVLEVASEESDWIVLKENVTSPYTHESLTKNMSFEYRIKAVNSAGNESEYLYTLGRTEYDTNYDDVMVDTTKPIIDLIDINPVVDYVGASQELVLTFESFDENYNRDLTKLVADSFIINVGGAPNSEVVKSMTKEVSAKGERFILTISNITESGKLTVEIPAGVIIDSALNANDATVLKTETTVKNGETTTKDAPTINPDVHSMVVSLNQVNTIPIKKIIYEYRLSGAADFIVASETTNKTITISGLSSNTEYEVRTTVIDIADNSVTSNSAFAKTLKVDASNISIRHETTAWTNLIAPMPEVIATIEWNDTNYMHEYSLNGTDWSPATESITRINITENLTLYARYSDGVGKSDAVEHEINNIDKKKPKIGSFKIPTGMANTKEIVVSEISDEGGSLVKGYYINDEASLGNATWSDLTETSFTFTASKEIKYYVWVIDNAGNISEATVIDVKDVAEKVSEVKVPNNIEVEVFKTVTPEIEITGEPESVKWEIEDDSFATIVPETGAITGIASGETTVKVTVTDYDGTETIKEIPVKVIAVIPTLEINEPKEFNFTYGDAAAETTFVYSGSEEINVSSSDENVATATINQNKVIITPGAVGNATITLTTPEIPGYATVSKTISVTVVPRTLVVIWSGDTFTYDGTEKSVVAIPQNMVVGDIISINYTGNTYTDVENYTAKITGLIGPDSANYRIDNMENSSHNWVIEKADRDLNITPTSLAVSSAALGKIKFDYKGDDVEALVDDGDGSIIKATLEDRNCGGEISVESISIGEENITITIPGSNNYKSASGTVKVISSPVAAEIVVDSKVILTYGESKEITYTYAGDGDITVTPSDPSIIEIEHDDVTGTIKIKSLKASDEEVLITIKAEATEEYEGAEKTVSVKVYKKPLVVSWSGDTFTYDGNPKEVIPIPQNLLEGDIVNLSYTGNKYTDTGRYVATITGLSGPDALNYTLEYLENTSHEWVIEKGERDLNLPEMVEAEFGTNKEIIFTYKGEDVTAEATIANEDIATITYEDLNLSGKIIITPVQSGETTVSVSVPESKNYNAGDGSFKLKVLAIDPTLDIDTTPLTFVYGESQKEIVFSVTENINVVAESSKTDVADVAVSDNKVVLDLKNRGTTIITVSTVETNQYNSISKEISVTVLPRPVELDWGNIVIPYDGTPKTVTATVINAVQGDSVIVMEYDGNTETEVGAYEAEATRLSNDNYTLVDGTNIKIQWQIISAIPPEIIVRQGDTIISSGNWASGDVTIEISEVAIVGSTIGYEYSYNKIDWFDYTGVFNYETETTGTTIYARAYNKKNGIVITKVGEYNLKLDKTDPKIIIGSIEATNSISGIINKNSEITIELSIEEIVSGLMDGEFTVDDIKVLSNYNGETIELLDITKTLVEDEANTTLENGTYKYTLTLKNIETSGRLSLRIDEKSINDRATRFNETKNINIGLVSDNKGPTIGKITSSADEYGRVYGNIVNLEVGAIDDSGIKSYEWQVSKNGTTWETFIKDETSAEISDVIYEALDKGVHHFRVIVTDIVGNSSTSNMISINIDTTVNRKPTIRFEIEQVAGTRVKIKAIIKSAKKIQTIAVNSIEIEASMWNITQTNSEITVVTEYIATSNGAYVWKATDEIGNTATETINITTIDTEAATVIPKAYDVTEYAPAKIEFTSNKEVRISKVITPDGKTKNIINRNDFTGMTFSTVDFAKKIIVSIQNIDFEKGTIFVFENKAFIETYVTIETDIATKVMYIRVVSEGTNLFNTLFTQEFTLENAEMLVNQMSNKTKLIGRKVASYYGISSSPVIIKVSNEDELKAVGYLAGETDSGKTYKMNEYGDYVKLDAIVANDVELNTTYTNGNISGLKIYGNILNWTGASDKNTFRITIRAK